MTTSQWFGIAFFFAAGVCGLILGLVQLRIRRFLIPESTAFEHFLFMGLRQDLYEPQARPLVQKAQRLVLIGLTLALFGLVVVNAA